MFGILYDPSVEEKCVARALLSAEIMEGNHIYSEMMEYYMVNY